MNQAVFLDRDGVIIKEKHHLSKINDVEIIFGAAEAIKKLNKKFLVLVVSNQSVVARRISTSAEVKKINSYISKKLSKEGAKIDAFYFCPHHPLISGKCDCRKPEIGLLLKAKNKFKLDFSESFLVGDKTLDIKTGENAGCKTILVKTGYAGKDKEYKVNPDHTSKNLLDAAKIMLKEAK
ncbi:MAG TPA: HAD family hydrolase [archaeon]|nr:HAD family hydrolase [archaeon]